MLDINLYKTRDIYEKFQIIILKSNTHNLHDEKYLS